MAAGRRAEQLHRFDGLALLLPYVDREDIGTFQAKLSKMTATGGEFSLTHDVDYAKTNLFNNVLTGYPADWNVKLDGRDAATVVAGRRHRVQPDCRARGKAGAIQRRGARADQHRHRPGRFRDRRAESRQRRGNDLLGTVLHLPELRRRDRRPRQRPVDLAEDLQPRPPVPEGGEAERKAQAREQYFVFRSGAERSLNALYVTEAKLRYLLGVAATDGRLIRPQDEPTTAKVVFDWNDVLNEGLVRSVELREQKWIVKRRELELVAAKNFLLPRLDFLAQYQWLGMGNRLDGCQSAQRANLRAGSAAG